MEYFPLFVDLKRKPCLVIGGGVVALRKIRQLLAADAQVTVNAPDLHPELAEWVSEGRLRHENRAYDEDLISDHFLVIAATDDTQINTRVYQAATRLKRLVNAVDDPKRSNYITPAVVDRSPIIVAISSGGAAPVLARRIRAKLEVELPKRLGQLAELARRFRPKVKKLFSSLSDRRQFWERTLEGPVADLAYAGDLKQAEGLLDQALRSPSPEPGQVGLVGAGPGDRDLMTLRGLQWLQTADVILYDRLVTEEVLELARRDAEFVFVGKTPGCKKNSQDEIIQKLIHYAKMGQRVCRLKGGDPFIFGRGGEELQALAQAGINFEVVPGITAAAGAAAYAGIPLTHRDFAQSVKLVTAHCQRSLDCLDWEGLAQEKQTLVFYMGVGRLQVLQDKLIEYGKDPETPIAFIENATRQNQRVIRGSLSTLWQTAQTSQVVSPSVLMVGGVTSLADELAWFQPDQEQKLQQLAYN